MKFIKNLTIFLGFFILLIQGGNAWGGWAYSFYQWEETKREEWGRFMSRDVGKHLTPLLFWEEAVAEWNPIGNAFGIIEQRVPGLDIRGRLSNRTRISMHGNVNEGNIFPFHPNRALVGIKAASMDPDVQEAEWLTELEINYKPNPHINFDTILNFRYDAAYDWDDKFERFYKGTRRKFELQNYRTEKTILREIYLDFFYDPWEIRIGKHQEAWGKIISRVMDFINPDFFTIGVGEEGRNPLWMANFKYYWKEYFFQYLFIPDFEELIARDSNTYRPLNRPAPSPVVRPIFLNARRPDFGFDDSEHAFRFGFQRAGWEANLSYFYTWEDRAPIFLRRTLLPRDPITGRPTRPTPANPIRLILEPTHNRINQYGFSVVKDWNLWYRSWRFRVEGLYTTHRYISTSDRTDPDGVTRQEDLKMGMEVESRLFRDFNWTFTWLTTRTFGWNPRLMMIPIKKMDRLESSFVFFIFKSFYNSRATTSFQSFFNDDGDGFLVERFRFALSNYLDMTLEFQQFQGSNTDDIFGMNNSRDYFRFVLTYTF